MFDMFWHACLDDEAQDIAEYAVMLAVILVLVVGTIRLVGSNANKVFSSVASSFTNEGWGQPTSWIYSQQLHTDPQ